MKLKKQVGSDVLNLLLQILEDGILTDNMGRTVNFKNTIIIMTSNVGSKLICRNKKLGFGDTEYIDLKKEIEKEASLNFAPEFLNRIDEIVIFNKLKNDELKEIVNLMLNKIVKRMKRKNIEIDFDDNINDFVINKLENRELGARPIRRIIESTIVNKIANEYLSGNIKEGEKIKIFEKNNQLEFELVDSKYYIASVGDN